MDLQHSRAFYRVHQISSSLNKIILGILRPLRQDLNLERSPKLSLKEDTKQTVWGYLTQPVEEEEEDDDYYDFWGEEYDVYSDVSPVLYEKKRIDFKRYGKQNNRTEQGEILKERRKQTSRILFQAIKHPLSSD